MATTRVVKYGEESLRQPSKEVTKITSKIKKLVDTLVITMYKENGVGLAAPQIGVNLRVFVIDTSTNDEPLNPRVFINPKIIHKSGAVNSEEGCLSFPNAIANVRRFADVTIVAKDMKNKPFKLEAKGGTLLARCLQHETDHLNGVLFIDHSRNRFDANKSLKDNNLLPIDDKFLLAEKELETELQQLQVSEKEEV